MEHYYVPMQASFEAFLDKHGQSQAAEALIEAERNEIALYEQYSDYVSYGFYVAQKLGD
ncbi:MAG: hypothetical protein AAGF20_08210 [Pseudomonadota bacterium]